MEHERSQRTQKTLYPLYINPYELCYMLAYHVQDAFSPLFCRHHYGYVDKHGYLYADKPPLENQYSYGWLGLVDWGLLSYSLLFYFNPIWWLCGFIILSGIQGTIRISFYQHSLLEVILGFVVGMFCGIIGILFI